MQAAANTLVLNELGADGLRAVVADLTLDLGAARAAALVGAASATATSAVTAAAPGPTPDPGTHKRRAAGDLPDTPSKYGEGFFRTNPKTTPTSILGNPEIVCI